MSTSSVRLTQGREELEEARRRWASTGNVIVKTATGGETSIRDDAIHVASSSSRAPTPTGPPGCASPPSPRNPSVAMRIRGCYRRKRPVAAGAAAAAGVAGVTGLFHLVLVLVLAAARLVPVCGHPGGEWQHPRSRPRPHLPRSADGELDFGRRGGSETDDAGRRARYDAETEPRSAEPAGGGASQRRRSGSTRETVELARAEARAVRAAAVGGVRSTEPGGNSAMLFLECEVNGRPLRAFVDTGAQVTVMSEACAERCGLASEIDTRFAGRAVGVGSARILGRIHDAQIRIGNSFLTCSFTVIEHAEIDLLVGLDVLRAHRCDISLSKNRMRFHAGGKAKEVAFLKWVETHGRRERRHRPGRTSAPCRENTSSEHHSEGRGDGGRALPPRILRERSRGTRDGGDDDAANWDSRKASAMTGRRGPRVGASQRIGPILPRKLRGWPPRGGEGVLEEAFLVREDCPGPESSGRAS